MGYCMYHSPRVLPTESALEAHLHNSLGNTVGELFPLLWPQGLDFLMVQNRVQTGLRLAFVLRFQSEGATLGLILFPFTQRCSAP